MSIIGLSGYITVLRTGDAGTKMAIVNVIQASIYVSAMMGTASTGLVEKRQKTANLLANSLKLGG